jgi:Family of unknown function (DUF6194)
MDACHSLPMLEFVSDDLIDATSFVDAVVRQLPGIVTSAGSGDTFLFYDPDGITDTDNRFPFGTVVTGDRYDAASRLDRDATTYRVNLGVPRASYEQLFGPAPRQAAGHEVIDTGFDYTATDTLVPHPFYAPLHWVAVVNPGMRTAARLAGLTEQAHALARSQYDRRRR